MPVHVFAYGSLMFGEVWSRVVSGRYRSCPARLSGFERLVVRGETYPGAIARPGGVIDGVLYRGVEAADLARLDRFEGDDYERRTVTVVQVSDIVEVPGTFEVADTVEVANTVKVPSALEAPGMTGAPGAVDMPGPGSAWCAQVYVHRDPGRLAAAAWDPDWFAREGIARFLREYVGGQWPEPAARGTTPADGR